MVILMHTYILMCRTIIIPNVGTPANWNNRKNVIIKHFSPFTDCISEIDNKQIHNAKDIDVVIPSYNLMECGDNYWKQKVDDNTIEI